MSTVVDFNFPDTDRWLDSKTIICEHIILVYLWVSSITDMVYFYIRPASSKTISSDSFVYQYSTNCGFNLNSASVYCNKCRLSKDYRNQAKASFSCSECHFLVEEVNKKPSTMNLFRDRGFFVFMAKSNEANKTKVSLSFFHQDSNEESHIARTKPYPAFRDIFNEETNSDVTLCCVSDTANQDLKNSTLTLLRNSDKTEGSVVPQDKSSETKVSFKLHAHRTMLSKGSTFFKNMFISGFTESNEKVIKISSCSAECLKAIVYFIYTQDFTPYFIQTTSYELWSEIIQVSEEWGIPELTRAAQLLTLVHVNSENAFELLQHCKDLKESGDIHVVLLNYVQKAWNDVCSPEKSSINN